MTLRYLSNEQLKRWVAVKDILHCIYIHGFKTRIVTSVFLVVIGILNKLFSLLIFVVVIQAVVALVLPDKINFVLQKLDAPNLVKFISDNLEIFAYGSIVFVQIGSVILTLAYQYLWAKLASDMLSETLIIRGKWEPKDDSFMIDHLSAGAQSLLKVLTAAGYMLILVFVLAVFSFALVMLVLPLLGVVVLLQLTAIRSEIDQRQLLNKRKAEWSRSYRSLSKDGTSEGFSRYFQLRFKFLETKKQGEKKAALNTVWLTVLGSALMLIIVYSITKVPDIDVTLLAGYLIFFVFAVRGIVSSLKEVSVNFNRILNLRKYRSNISSLLKTTLSG